ncbi:MAG: hypothetical protein LBO05_04560 [Deltaproteobacteria bacterium]|jgi:hypothetical protein|nr:hypothetical protein [Deltaproteobacteria bacterium]
MSQIFLDNTGEGVNADSGTEKVSSSQWYDTLWKSAIQLYLTLAVRFFFPYDFTSQLDFSTARNGQTEFLAHNATSSVGKRIVDACIDVRFKKPVGIYQSVMILFEQQHSIDYNMGYRMLQVYDRASNIAKSSLVITIAILTGEKTDEGAYNLNSQFIDHFFKPFYYNINSYSYKDLMEIPNNFTLFIIAAKKKLEAGLEPENRVKYYLEMLDILKMRFKKSVDSDVYEEDYYFFAMIIGMFFRIESDDIDPAFRENHRMTITAKISSVLQVRDLLLLAERQSGFAEGEVRGEVRGEARGEARGGRQKALEVAASLLAMDFPVKMIASVTKLEESEVAALKDVPTKKK